MIVSARSFIFASLAAAAFTLSHVTAWMLLLLIPQESDVVSVDNAELDVVIVDTTESGFLEVRPYLSQSIAGLVDDLLFDGGNFFKVIWVPDWMPRSSISK